MRRRPLPQLREERLPQVLHVSRHRQQLREIVHQGVPDPLALPHPLPKQPVRHPRPQPLDQFRVPLHPTEHRRVGPQPPGQHPGIQLVILVPSVGADLPEPVRLPRVQRRHKKPRLPQRRHHPTPIWSGAHPVFSRSRRMSSAWPAPPAWRPTVPPVTRATGAVCRVPFPGGGAPLPARGCSSPDPPAAAPAGRARRSPPPSRGAGQPDGVAVRGRRDAGPPDRSRSASSHQRPDAGATRPSRRRRCFAALRRGGAGLETSTGKRASVPYRRAPRRETAIRGCVHLLWSGRPDLNRRPLAPQASALPDCATSRRIVRILVLRGLQAGEPLVVPVHQFEGRGHLFERGR